MKYYLAPSQIVVGGGGGVMILMNDNFEYKVKSQNR